MGSHHSSPSTSKHHFHIHHSFPRVMQVLKYDDPEDETSKIKLEQLRSAHEMYVQCQSSEGKGKLNAHLLASMKMLVERGIPIDDMSYYFDDATEDDLEDFARNDPWVQAGLIKHWIKQFQVEVEDPAKALQTFKAAFGPHH